MISRRCWPWGRHMGTEDTARESVLSALLSDNYEITKKVGNIGLEVRLNEKLIAGATGDIHIIL